MEAVEQNRPSRRKPHKTHKIVSDSSSTSDEVTFVADADIASASNVEESHKAEVVQPPRPTLTPSKLSSEPLGLPEGTIVVQPEDATDSPFQGPEFYPAESSNSDLPESSEVVDVEPLPEFEHCTVCRNKLDATKRDSIFRHSMLNVLLCKRCYTIHERQVSESKSAAKNFCVWCSAGVSLVCCDECPSKFCKTCIRRNFGRPFLQSILDSDEDKKWHCFICDPEPLSDLVQSCSEFISHHLKCLAQGGGNVKRRRSAGNVPDVPQKKSKPAPIITITPQAPDKPCLMKSRVGICKLPLKVTSPSKQAVASSPPSVVNGGSVTIHRPEYDADMIPVDEHNVWPVLEKVLAATQSMSMLLGSLKDDLQRSSAMEARMKASGDNPMSDISFKRREAAVKLWRAFDAYLKSFVNVETYARESNVMVKTGGAPSSE